MDSWFLVGVSFELMNLGFLSFSSLSSFLIASLFCLLFLSPYFPFILFFLFFLLPSYCLFTFSSLFSFLFFLLSYCFSILSSFASSSFLYVIYMSCLSSLLSFFITFVFFLPLLLRSCMLLVRLAFHRFKVCVCVYVRMVRTHTLRLLQVDIHKLGWYTQFGLRYTRFGGMCALIGGGAHGLDR